MVKINSVISGSPAAMHGLKKGDELISVNGHEINDVLDYKFYTTERKIKAEYRRGGTVYSFTALKPEYEEFGCEFETYLIDRKRSCANNCIFCFIDQNPEGMRETIYFKDDDERLSFLHGSYITMTNLGDKDISRIINMHISPINVSVHTTDKELRVKMLGNRRAGEVLKYLDTLSEHGIALNTQIVLCRDVNDGEALASTLEDLSKLKSLRSVSVVPSGLTKHREGLYPLKPFDKASALETIRITESARKKHKKNIFASDEFYLIAGAELPDYEEYDDFPQLENGVGMIREFEDEFLSALRFEDGDDRIRKATVATGYAAYECIRSLVSEFEKKFTGSRIEVVRIENVFYGSSVTVSGLIVGEDLINGLAGRDLGSTVMIPCNMLRYERDLFLDGKSVADAEKALNVPLTVTERDGADLLDKLIEL